MHIHSRLYRFGIAALLPLMLLAACAGNAPLRQQYDLGPLIAGAAKNSAGKHLALSLAEVQAAPALDGHAMLYRLLYDNPQQLKPYAQARWSMPPAQLFAQRLKTTLSTQGHLVVNSVDGVQALPVLRLEIDEFAQAFTSASASNAQLQLRAAVFQGRKALAQRIFTVQVPAGSADAAGGARALRDACDQAISEMAQWLQTLPIAESD